MLFLKGHTDRVRCVAYSPDGATLASCGEDGTVLLWNPAKGRKRKTLYKHARRTVYAVAFSPDGAWLASASGDRMIRLWELPAVRGAPDRILEEHSALVTSLAFSSDGRILLSGSGNSGGQLKMWKLPQGESRTLSFMGGVWSVVLAPDNDRIAAIGLGSEPGELILLDTQSLDVLLLKRQPSRVRAAALAPGGRLAATTDGSDVRVWSLGSRGLAILKGHTATVHGLAFAPGGRTLASASHDGTVRLWDAIQGQERACFEWPTGQANCVAFAPDGTTVAAGGEKDIVIWDVDEDLI